MLIKEKTGNIVGASSGKKTIDKLEIEWFEANKRIMHRQTVSGQKVSTKFLQENPDLKEGDILYEDDTSIISIEIKPCESIIITPTSIMEAASVCYEIGNKHLPLFYEGNELLVPYEAPLYRLLAASGYSVKVEKRKLQYAIKTSVSPHAHQQNSTSLFNKILHFTKP